MYRITDIKDCLGSNHEVVGDLHARFDNFTPIESANERSLIFSKRGYVATKAAITLVPQDAKLPHNILSGAFIKVLNPRLVFARILAKLVEETSDEVEMGGNVTIEPGVILSGKVVIGNNVVIHSNAVIGTRGEAYEKDESGVPIPLPHIGGVVIGDNVEIGPNTTISRGTLSNTIIEDDAKIGSNCHIAHNARIGKRTLVITSAVSVGSAIIGDDCWLAPNCTIMNGIR